ncbi:MAG: DUF3892 domain-containing protein [Armatimonadetes bacterium]|nr:DUF3892 domain-containing protein [Armatimonadota bacterium]
MADTVKIVKVRKNAKGEITHVVYSDGKAETLNQAIKRAKKGGIANFDAVTPKEGKPYLRKARGQKKGLAELPVEKAEKPAAAKPKRGSKKKKK